jgi:hypothetical protein
MPGLFRSHTTGDYGGYRDGGRGDVDRGGNDAAFEHIERLGRSIYDRISGKRQADKEEREREERRAARHQQRRDEERERHRQRHQRGGADREDRVRNVERVERIVADLHGVSGTLRDMSRRPPRHTCDFYDGFAQREKRMQRALGGAIGGLRDVGVVHGREGRHRRREGGSGRSEQGSRRSERARSCDGGGRHHAGTTAGSSGGGRAGRKDALHSSRPAPSDATQSTRPPSRRAEADYAATPSMRRRKRRAGGSVGSGLNEGYYGPGNPTYESDPAWRSGEETRERMHREHAAGGSDEGGRQGSTESRRPRRE